MTNNAICYNGINDMLPTGSSWVTIGTVGCVIEKGSLDVLFDDGSWLRIIRGKQEGRVNG